MVYEKNKFCEARDIMTCLRFEVSGYSRKARIFSYQSKIENQQSAIPGFRFWLTSMA